jgi:pilus assembly protein CpaB
MFLRNLLLAIGAVFVLAGVGLFIAWFGQTRNPTVVVERRVASQPAILAAAREIPAGGLLRKEDIVWKEVGPGAVGPGNLLRGQVSETEFLGAISRRDVPAGQALVASEFVKPGDRRFLAAVLKPGSRAISISVDAAQSAAGLALPGDHVDIILTQDFGENAAEPGRKTVGETMLRDVRVIAVDQSLNPMPAVGAERGAATADSRLPKTVTLELHERQAEALLVGAQLGKLQLAVRPLEGSPTARLGHDLVSQDLMVKPVWASDVSQALKQITPAAKIAAAPNAPPAPRKCDPDDSITGSTLECLVRRPPALAFDRSPRAMSRESLR